VVGHVGTEDNWGDRRQLLLSTVKVYDRLQPLVEGAKANTISLALFKPKRVHEFYWEECEREWDPKKIAVMMNHAAQGILTEPEHWRTLKLIPKLPYDFWYRFTDADGKESNMRVLDWELGQYFWEMDRLEAPTLKSFVPIRVGKRYFEEFRKTDLHFFLGTIHRFQTWTIVGVVPIPY
jgi:hypothetical protein